MHEVKEVSMITTKQSILDEVQVQVQDALSVISEE